MTSQIAIRRARISSDLWDKHLIIWGLASLVENEVVDDFKAFPLTVDIKGRKILSFLAKVSKVATFVSDNFCTEYYIDFIILF